MHRAGRIGAHKFDVDWPFRARRPGAKPLAVTENRLQDFLVTRWLQDDIDETGASGLRALHVRLALEISDKGFRKRARIRASKLGFPRIDHRRVGREVAMGRLARRLDDAAAEIEVARQFSRRNPLFEQARDARLEVGENIHYSYRGESQCQDVAVSVMAGLVRPSTW